MGAGRKVSKHCLYLDFAMKSGYVWARRDTSDQSGGKSGHVCDNGGDFEIDGSPNSLLQYR